MDAVGDWGDDDSEDDDSDDSDDDSSSSRERAPRVDDDDDDGRRPVPGTLFLETQYLKYVADVAAANRDNVKPSGNFRRMHAEEEDLHRAALRTAPEDLVYAKDWRLPLPCRPSQLVGMCYVHTSLARYYEEGMRLPPGTGRVDHVNDRFWKDRDLVCEVFRREYGFDDDAELPTTCSPSSVRFARGPRGDGAAVGRAAAHFPLPVAPASTVPSHARAPGPSPPRAPPAVRARRLRLRRWKVEGCISDDAEVLRYYGAKRFQYATASTGRAARVYTSREQCGLLGL